jgi:hypothetical protein
MSLKSNLTCSFCSKIFKDPIELPCGDLICKEHLTAIDVQKQNKIKCIECKKEFPVKNEEFKSVKLIQKMLDSKLYLSDNEKCLKQQIDESIRDFYKLYEEFTQNKTSIDSDVYNHLHELRFQIDEHREKLKQKIDDIALAMIEQTQKFEAEYLKTLNDQLDAPLESFNKKSIDNDLMQIDELFRDPNLLLESIQGLQRKEQDAIGSIRFKLNEMSQIRDNLKVSNKFETNLSFSQVSFRTLYLKDYLGLDLFNSSILTKNQSMDLMNLCEFSKKDKWSLLYRASRDGFWAKEFHTKCDGHSNTLTIFKAKDTSYIFGGYTSASWESLPGKHKSDPTAFIFSLTNKDKQPFKSKIKPNQHDKAVYCCSEEGPSFGDSDIIITNNFNSELCSSDIGNSYIHPQGNMEDKFVLTGSNQFLLSEIEVYKKE